jgi:hypothetical protein
MWEQRRILMTSDARARRHAAARRLEAAIESLSPWRVYVEILVSEARTQLRAAESRAQPRTPRRVSRG